MVIERLDGAEPQPGRIDAALAGDLADVVDAVIAPLIFQYATGSDRARHSGMSFATGQAQAAASGIRLTSTEHALACFAARACKNRIGGEL